MVGCRFVYIAGCRTWLFGRGVLIQSITKNACKVKFNIEVAQKIYFGLALRNDSGIMKPL